MREGVQQNRRHSFRHPQKARGQTEWDDQRCRWSGWPHQLLTAEVEGREVAMRMQLSERASFKRWSQCKGSTVGVTSLLPSHPASRTASGKDPVGERACPANRPPTSNRERGPLEWRGCGVRTPGLGAPVQSSFRSTSTSSHPFWVWVSLKFWKSKDC